MAFSHALFFSMHFNEARIPGALGRITDTGKKLTLVFKKIVYYRNKKATQLDRFYTSPL